MLWCIVYIVSLITGLVSAPEEIEKDKVGEPMALESNAPPLAPAVVTAVKQAVVTAVKQFEGCSPRAFWDYRQYSIGYGTRALSPDEMIDCETEAEQRLIVELGRAQMQVDALGVPLTAAQRAALTSLTFNAGASWTQSGLGEAVRAGNWIRARDIFLRYVRANGEVLEGLVRRRRAEVAWFEGELIAAIAEQPPAGEPAASAAARKVRAAGNGDGDKDDRPHQIVKKEQVKVASRDEEDNEDRSRRSLAAARKVRAAGNGDGDKDDRPHQIVKKEQVKVASRDEEDNEDRSRRSLAAARKVRAAGNGDGDKDDRPHQIVKKEQVKVASRDEEDNEDRSRRSLAAARKVRAAGNGDGDKDDRPHQIVKKEQVKVASRDEEDNEDRSRRRRWRHRDNDDYEDN